jgi:hypothetical protein
MAIYRLTTPAGRERLIGPTGLAWLVDDADLDQPTVDAIELLDVGERLPPDADFVDGWTLERVQ